MLANGTEPLTRRPHDQSRRARLATCTAKNAWSRGSSSISVMPCWWPAPESPGMADLDGSFPVGRPRGAHREGL